MYFSVENIRCNPTDSFCDLQCTPSLFLTISLTFLHLQLHEIIKLNNTFFHIPFYHLAIWSRVRNAMLPREINQHNAVCRTWIPSPAIFAVLNKLAVIATLFMSDREECTTYNCRACLWVGHLIGLTFSIFPPMFHPRPIFYNLKVTR